MYNDRRKWWPWRRWEPASDVANERPEEERVSADVKNTEARVVEEDGVIDKSGVMYGAIVFILEQPEGLFGSDSAFADKQTENT